MAAHRQPLQQRRPLAQCAAVRGALALVAEQLLLDPLPGRQVHICLVMVRDPNPPMLAERPVEWPVAPGPGMDAGHHRVWRMACTRA